jgi:hypothetical protein
MTHDPWETLINARIKLWFCPLDSEHRKEYDALMVRVEWDGNRATCLICGADNGGEV